MNFKVLYSNKKNNDFSKTLRKRVNQYFERNNISRHANKSMIFKTIVMLSLYIVPYILIISNIFQPWLIIIFYIIMGIGTAGIGMNVMHDAAHNSYSKNKSINKIIGASMYLVGGNIYNWKIQHNYLHHFHTNIYGLDEDIETKFLLRLSPHSRHRFYHRLQPFYAVIFYSLMTMSFLLQDLQQLFRFRSQGLIAESEKSFFKEVMILISTKTLYLTLLLLLPLLLSFSWSYILLGFLLMHLTAGLIMSTVFQLAHQVEGLEQPLPDKDGKIDHNYSVHQLLIASDFSQRNKFITWFTGGLNFQIEHHLYPSICHVHYPAISIIVKKTAREYQIPYHYFDSFFGALKSHVKTLSILGHQKAS